MTVSLSFTEMAVIGDDVLANGLRLAGVRRCYAVTAPAECDVRDEVRKILGTLLCERGVSIIVILDTYAQHARDLLDTIRQSRQVTPVIIEIPSIRNIDYEAVKEDYKRFVRRFIGFDLEI